jgi:hypothetical protein
MSIICLECLSEFISPEDVNIHIKECHVCNPDLEKEETNGKG